MNVQIDANEFPLTDRVREHIAWRIAYATSHGPEAVSRIVVRLTNVSGPRGVLYKCCAVQLRLKNAQSLAIEDVQADLDVAIDRAFERVSRSLQRRLVQRRDFAAFPVAHQHTSVDTL